MHYPIISILESVYLIWEGIEREREAVSLRFMRIKGQTQDLVRVCESGALRSATSRPTGFLSHDGFLSSKVAIEHFKLKSNIVVLYVC